MIHQLEAYTIQVVLRLQRSAIDKMNGYLIRWRCAI
jgi:hypothetical protein